MRLQDEKGFTLVEIMVVIGVIAIMATIAIPNYINWLPNMRLKAAARDLYAATMRAKGEAVKQNTNCALTFGQLVAGRTYAYIAYVDTNSNCEYDAGEVIVARMEQWPQNVRLDPTQGGGDGLTFTDNDDGNPTIAFRPSAIPTANGGGFANGSAFITNSNGMNRSVVVSQAGNITIN